MLGNGAKRTAPKAATHDIDAEANHLPSRDFGHVVVAAVFVCVARVWAACVGQVKNIVHLSRGEWYGGRGDPHITCGYALTMGLDQCACVAGIGFQVQHAIGMGVKHGIAFDLLVRRQTNDGAVTRRHPDLALRSVYGGRQRRIDHKGQRFDGRIGLGSCNLGNRLSLVLPRAGCALLFGHIGDHHVRVDMRFYPARRIHTGGINLKPALRCFVTRAADERRAANIGHGGYGFFGGQAVCNFNNRTLGVAVQQQITFGIHHHRAANFVRPVVVMRNPAQAAFNAAQNNRHILEGFSGALAVHECGTIRPLAANIARCVGVVRPDFVISRIAVDHAVHVAGGDAPKQVWLA